MWTPMKSSMQLINRTLTINWKRFSNPVNRNLTDPSTSPTVRFHTTAYMLSHPTHSAIRQN
ncbi:hypothetical protein AHF37_09750 [Paragonimus kellicotti]|nr:hypothetical protein AHF37_09750 [Paragonimus kellicotti]